MVEEENSHSRPADRVDSTEPGDSVDTTQPDTVLEELRLRLEMEKQIRQLEEPERALVRHKLAQRIQELEELEEEERQKLVREALGKFGFFMHMTAFIAGCSYLVLLGVLVPKAMPWVFIPIGLWCIGFAYHGWRAWHPKPPGDKAAKKALKELDKQQNHNGDQP